MNRTQPFEELTRTREELEALLARITTQVSPQDYQIIEASIRGVPQLLELIKHGPMSMRKLSLIVFGPKTEKTSRV